MDDRKARLAALAAKAGRAQKPDVLLPPAVVDEQDNEDNAAATTTRTSATQHQQQQSRNVKFRNYTPQDAQLEEGGGGYEATSDEPDAKRVKTTTTTTTVNKNRPAELSVLEQALAQAKAEISSGSGTQAAANNIENDLIAVAPKKINWDLKRDIQPKLDKLEKRTQRAIVEMLRERLEKEAADDLD